MRRPVRRLGAVLAGTVMLLAGCQVPSEPDPAASPPSESVSDPGDRLPGGRTSAEPTDNAGEPTDGPDEPTGDSGEGPTLGRPGIPECDVLEMPATVLPVIEDIEAGGPYDYPRNDGVRFQNREGLLPDEDRDYYREFTVETPGEDHRGARRIVTGGFDETDPDHWFYTDDHYESFCEFDPELIADR